MKILIAGAYDNVPHTTVKFMEKAFKSLEHDVSIFDFRRIRKNCGNSEMELEMIAGKAEGSYEHQLEGLDPIRILPQPIIRGVVMDMAQKKDHSLISAKFHNTIIALLVDICEILKKQHGLNRVAISGGVFQNAILLCGLVRTLQKRQFEVYTQKLVPCNDGGISLGQAIAAAAIA